MFDGVAVVEQRTTLQNKCFAQSNFSQIVLKLNDLKLWSDLVPMPTRIINLLLVLLQGEVASAASPASLSTLGDPRR
jgi:hypothetical protein